jgi:GNAT superfamily N-acetyltransferase
VPLEIVALQDEHLEDAAALVSVRYRALRQRVPLLPPRYEDVATLLPMLRDLTRQAPGVVALRGDRLVGFLVGSIIPMFLGKRSMYSPEWANGADLWESRRVYEEMYGCLAAEWVADGCFTHVVSMLGHDHEGIAGWQWLGFGLAAIDGLRGVEPTEAAAAEVEIRRAGIGDVQEATALDEALNQHMAAAPIFWMHEPEDYTQWLREPKNALWLAYDGGQVVGCMGLEPGHQGGCQIAQDEKTVSIMGAFVQEQARGKGIATALLNRSLEWARAGGYERCAADWEPMNVLAARFWPRHFELVCYSLMRCIDERIGLREATGEWETGNGKDLLPNL